MKDYKLSEKFALVGMDSLNSTHRTVAKKAVVKGIKAAQMLEDMLDNVGTPDEKLA